MRNVGRLADTVFDVNHTDKLYNERNGFVFNNLTTDGLNYALNRAIGLWYEYLHSSQELMVNGMRYDYSWNYPGGRYVNIY